MQPTAVPRELIQSVGGHIYHQGANSVALSPTKGTRNANIIYQTIKDLPKKTVIRADFNVFGNPYIFFPKKGRKLKNKLIDRTNIQAERNELANILNTISTSSARSAGPSSSKRSSSLLSLNRKASLIPFSRDFVVGDLKDDLQVLADAHLKSMRADASEQAVAKRRIVQTSSTKILDQRLRQFHNADSNLKVILARIFGSNANDDGKIAGLGALLAVKRLVKQYLNQPTKTKKSLAALIKENAHEPDLQLFAKLWILEMKMKAKEISNYPWAPELNGISRLILGQSISNTERGFDGDGSPHKYVYTRSALKPTERLDPGTPEDECLLANALGRFSGLNDGEQSNSPSGVFSRATPQHQSGYMLSSPKKKLDVTNEESSVGKISKSHVESYRSPDSPYLRVANKRRVREIMQQNSQRNGSSNGMPSMGSVRHSGVHISKISPEKAEVSPPDLLAHPFASALSSLQLRKFKKSLSFQSAEVSAAAMPIASVSSPFLSEFSPSSAGGAGLKKDNGEEVSHQFSDADE